MSWIRSHWSLLFAGLLVLLLAAFLITGKLQWAGGKTHSTESTSEGGEAAEKKVVQGNVVLDEEDFEASGIAIATVQEGSVGETLEAPGEVETAQNRLAQVTPSIGGIVRSVHKLAGDTVMAGDALCAIESTELGSARAELQSAIAERDVTLRNYNRWKELYEKGLRSQTEVWASEAEYNKAKLRVEAATAHLRAIGLDPSATATGRGEELSNRYELRSPLSGTVLQEQLTVGQNVEVKDVLFTVADVSQVWVNASLHESDIPKLHAGMTATLQVQSQGQSLAALDGTITNIGQQADQQTRTVPVRIAVANKRGLGGSRGYLLRPGMFLTVQFITARKNGVIAVPNDAIQQINGQAVVFVEVPANEHNSGTAPKEQEKNHDREESRSTHVLQPRAVTAGISDSKVTEITEGLKIGEKLVVRNAFLLKSELEKEKIGDQD